MIFLAPIFFAVGFVLNLYLGNIAELGLPALVVPVSAAAVFGAILLLIFSLILRNKVRGAVFASVFVVGFFVFGKYPFVGAVVIGAVFFLIWRTKRKLLGLAKYLLITALIITIVSGIRIGTFERERDAGKVKNPLVLPKVTIDRTRAQMPDIYYIVPDSYSASKSLLRYYGYDNSRFVNFLTGKGFYVAPNSSSNYPKTFLSLGSSLNMEYLDFLSVNRNSKDLSLVDPLIEDNNVVLFLKSLGYKYYHLGSWWGATHINKHADENVILENENKIPISQFEYIILKSTMAGGALDKYLPKITVGDSDVDRMNRLLYQFKKTKELASAPGPKFVFVHVIAPHEPYVFDKDCKYVPDSERQKKEETRKYIGQVECINRELESVVGEILKKSERPPVILIQSDEGAPFLGEELTPWENWKSASEALLSEKFPIFSAYYLPGADLTKVSPAITPVNSFRLIFNLYFGANFLMLPDRNYIMPDLEHVYDFIDVTDKVK